MTSRSWSLGPRKMGFRHHCLAESIARSGRALGRALCSPVLCVINQPTIEQPTLHTSHRQCAKLRHRSSVDKTENPLFVRERSENLFWRCSRTQKKRKIPPKRTKHGQNLFMFAHLSVNTPISGVHEQKMPVNSLKNGGGFREHKFHWGGRSSRPTDRPTRVRASSRRWCEYHRPVVLFVRFGSVAQPQAKHRGRFAHWPSHIPGPSKAHVSEIKKRTLQRELFFTPKGRFRRRARETKRPAALTLVLVVLKQCA